MQLELRPAIEPWHVLGEEAAAGGTARYVDSSAERVQVAVVGAVPGRHAGHLQRGPGAAAADRHAGRRTSPECGSAPGRRRPRCIRRSASHSPLIFDVVDLGAAARSAAAPTTSSTRAGDRTIDPPVNANEAEARRARRFEPMGHTTGVIDIDELTSQAAWRRFGADDYPLTLDLRRRLPVGWGRS